MQIPFRRPQITVGHQFFYGQDILALFKERGRKRVPQSMRREFVLFDLCLLKVFFDQMPHGTARHPLIPLA